METFDVAVIGLGAMGSMTVWQLAERNLKVLGFDQFRPPHALGSSGGLTRVIREAYYEQPYYVPLVQRAYQLWDLLERRTGRQVYWRTGGLMIGPPEGEIVAGAEKSARVHGLAGVELLSPERVRERFPVFRVPSEHVALYEPRAGVLAPDQGITSALELALRAGATLRPETRVTGWEPGSPIGIFTESGEYRAQNLVIATGAWIEPELARIGVPVSVARQVAFWLEPKGGRALFQSDRFPIFLWHWTRGHAIYGLPDLGDGFKAAIHHEGSYTKADSVDRVVHPGEERDLLPVLGALLPDGVGPVLRASVCLYTNTRDEDFVIDRHPSTPGVILVSPCSGHGFKFAPAIGEAVAQWITEGEPRLDLSHFRAARSALRQERVETGAHG